MHAIVGMDLGDTVATVQLDCLSNDGMTDPIRFEMKKKKNKTKQNLGPSSCFY